MALQLSTDHDQWPSLAPIRTTASSPYTHVADKETYQAGRLEQPYSHDTGDQHRAAAANTPAPHAFSRNSCFFPKPAAGFSSRPSDSDCCSYTNKFSCTNLLPNCFSCMSPRRRTSASPRHRCTPTYMHKSKYALRSLAFLFPSAGKMQSFYSSTPTAKAQLSGAYPRTLSGKIEHCMSPHTPGPTGLSSQLSGKNSQFSSPRTPASSRVQHFSGAIPSPRTPYGPCLTTSPASARRKKGSFTLGIPPGVVDKKKAFEQIVDEPSSPHVTCIGRVRRQTHCKKLLRSDTIDLCTNRHQTTKAKKKDTTVRLSSKHHSFPATYRSNNAQSQPTNSFATTEQPTNILEACTQSFTKKKPPNLHRIQGDGNETSYACNNVVVLIEAEQVANCLGPEEETTLIADCGDCSVHVAASQGISHIEKGTDLCTKSDNPLVNMQMNSCADSTEYGVAVGRPPECSDAANAVPTELPVAQRTTSTNCMLESLDEDEQLHEKPHHQGQRCLLLMRSTRSGRFLQPDRALHVIRK